MAHFPSQFHVKSDLTRGMVRVSLQVSEARVDEYWVPGEDIREVIAADGQAGWRGNGKLRMRFNDRSADIALFDDGGKRTVIRAFSSAARLFLSQLRAAASEIVPIDRVIDFEPPATPTVDEGVIQSAIRDVLQAEVGTMRMGIIDALKIEIQRVEKILASRIDLLHTVLPQAGPVISSPGPSVPSSGEPTFIPDIESELKGSLQVKDTTSSSVEAAAKALKKKTKEK